MVSYQDEFFAWHENLQLDVACRGRGFGRALLAEHSETGYRASGLAGIFANVQGMGSVIYAKASFDFFLEPFEGGTDAERRDAAVRGIVANKIPAKSDDGSGRLELPMAYLEGVAAEGADGAAALKAFWARMPGGGGGDVAKFRTPHDIVTFEAAGIAIGRWMGSRMSDRQGSCTSGAGAWVGL